MFAEKPGEGKRYATLTCDPPWRIEMGAAIKGIPSKLPYGTMTQEELLMLPVGSWAQGKAHLYLWTTNSMMEQAHQLVRAWDFKVSTIITWIKRGDEHRDGWMGMGRYYRNTTEHIIFAVRGALPVNRKNQPNFFYASRGAHSEKPAAFYDMVERMSPGPYLDVFSRKQRFNWDTWGNESFDFRTDGVFHG